MSFAMTFGHVQLLSGIILNFSYCSWLHFTFGRTFIRLIGDWEILKFRGIFYSLDLKEIFLGASVIKILEHEKCTWKDYRNRGVKLYVLGVHCHIIKSALRLIWYKWVRETCTFLGLIILNHMRESGSELLRPMTALPLCAVHMVLGVISSWVT